MKKALITGITGQDGAYLAEFLLAKGYEVHGIKRRSSLFNTARIDHLFHDTHEQGLPLYLHYGDLTDSSSLVRVIQKVQPDEVYNLGAQSHVKVSFDSPEYTAEVDGVGVLRMLESIRILGLEKKVRFYQASTSELYGLVQEIPQSETTPFYPRSPYAVAKMYGYWIVVNYREAYGMHASNGILFNHESPMRGETFVTRKITRAAARISVGLQNKLYLGNLSALRDWGHARDYVEMMWMMLQMDQPDDYVVATGRQTTVRDFVDRSFKEVGIELEWRGEDEKEVGVEKGTGRELVAVDPQYYRPTEVETLLGDPTKARVKLGWTPKIELPELVREMVAADLETAKKEALVKKSGFQVIKVLKKTDKIFLAGHRGLVGNAIRKRLLAGGYQNLILRTRSELDLQNQQAVNDFYAQEKPDAVILAAAKVGGIHANRTYPADFIGENLAIQQNVIWGAHLADVPQLQFLGSSCIYPRETTQPIPEAALLTGKPEPTNAPYAIAKIAGLYLCDSIQSQFGRNYFTVMPPNAYGDRDNYNLQTSHVLPALVRKFHEALPNKTVTCWGTGNPRREFLHSDDIADACVFLLEQERVEGHLNVGTGSSVSIRELAETIQRIVSHQGEIEWDTTMPDGFPEKTMDVAKLFALGWRPKISLEQGIQSAYSWFLANQTVLA